MTAAIEFYKKAEAWLKETGYWGEVEWFLQPNRYWEFLREYTWVVYCAGFRVEIVKQKFPSMAKWTNEFDPRFVVDHAMDVEHSLVSLINRRDKAHAIVTVANRMCRDPVTYLQGSLLARGESDALEFCESHPFIGPITKYHLARNLGFDVVKPDVHLVRLAKRFGFVDANALCEEISPVAKLRKGLVDLVLWRYCASGPGNRVENRSGAAQRLLEVGP